MIYYYRTRSFISLKADVCYGCLVGRRDIHKWTQPPFSSFLIGNKTFLVNWFMRSYIYMAKWILLVLDFATLLELDVMYFSIAVIFLR